MDLPNVDKWARIKGIQVIATGDFTHPEWLKHIKEKLEPTEEGLFRLKPIYKQNNNHLSDGKDPRFMLVTEISSIYSKAGKVRKIHSLIFLPSLSAVEKFNAQLGWIGNLKSDGRPILGLDVEELLKITLDISPDAMLVPAHLWTPWFSVFGSKSGFDSLKEAFGNLSNYIYAIETGLSSDPPMNWRLSCLDQITLISNSDAHSPRKLGREVNVIESELNYPSIINTIKKGDPASFLYTVEFFPQEGKYHYDGHRNCGIVFSPAESRKHKGVCPKCGRPLTIGVMYRVEELADRPQKDKPKDKPDFKSLIPLEEIIAKILGQNPGTKRVDEQYKNLIRIFGSEFALLLDAPISKIKSKGGPQIAEAIKRVREGQVKIEPGYDGVFGKIKIFEEGEINNLSSQKSLF
jgi:uncharacterized protein (TIGR00375 family)